MRQSTRFLFRPGQFFNQLQWSSRHGSILAAFILVAFAETYFGGYGKLYEIYAKALYLKFGWGLQTSVWALTTMKVSLMVVGVYLFSTVLWMIGNFIGSKKSKRVLFRRLSVVFTVMLLGYTAGHLTPQLENMAFFSFALYAYGTFLGFNAIQQQFEVNWVEAALISTFAIVLFTGTWKYSNTVVQEVAGNYLKISQKGSSPWSTSKRF